MFRTLRAACLLCTCFGILGCGGPAPPHGGAGRPLQPGPPLVPPPKIHAPPEPLRAEVHGSEVDAPGELLDLSLDPGGGVWLSAPEGIFFRPPGDRFFVGVGADQRVVGGIDAGAAVASQGEGDAILLRFDGSDRLLVRRLEAIHPQSARIRTFALGGGLRTLVASAATVVTLDPDGRFSSSRSLPITVEASDLVVVEGSTSADQLWIGTRIGVFRIELDGRGELAPYFLGPLDLIPEQDDDVVAMEACADGTVWISSLGHGVLRFGSDGRRLEHLRRESVLPQDHVLSIACDPDGSVWFGTSWGGLARRMSDGSFRYHNMSAGLLGDSIRRLAIEIDAEGDRILWIATENGLASYEGP